MTDEAASEPAPAITDEKARHRKASGLVSNPAVRNVCIVEMYSGFRTLDFQESIDILERKIAAIHAGDLTHVEASLFAQADALDVIFSDLAQRAVEDFNKRGNGEAFMRMALRAQNQCRMTLETLATIKRPPTVFANQANIAHGPQQVNNGTAPSVARAEEKAFEQTELLDRDNGRQRLDIGTTGAASRGDPAMPTVGALDRPANRQRQGDG